MRDEFSYFLESVEQAAYIASAKYGVTIRLEQSATPRLYIFLGNTKSEDDFIIAISSLDQLLPQLINSIS